MEEEFHAIIKLVSGEEIFSLVMVENPDDEDPLLVLQNPLIMYMHSAGRSQYIKVKPWLDLTDEDIYMIRLSKVITMTESKNEKLIADMEFDFDSQLRELQSKHEIDQNNLRQELENEKMNNTRFEKTKVTSVRKSVLIFFIICENYILGVSSVRTPPHATAGRITRKYLPLWSEKNDPYDF